MGKLVAGIGILFASFNLTFAQILSTFPEDSPRPWGGGGLTYPDIGISIQIFPRSVPVILRPQVDFGIFQPHGHVVNGGKVSLVYLTPFSTLGIGRAYIGGIVGYNADRMNSRRDINGHRVLEEEQVFLWGGVLGEMVELYKNFYLTGEIRFLNQEVTSVALDPAQSFDRHRSDRYRTTWMIGLQYYFW